MTPVMSAAEAFDLVFGLPLHVLVNHAVVVLIPLGALAMILMVFVPRLRKSFSYVSAGITLLGAVAATVAAQSGEALSERVGYPGVHQEWGETLVPVAWALVAVSVAWVVLPRFTGKAVRVGQIVASVAVVGLSVASIVFVILAGHSGAEVTWKNRVAAETTTVTPSATASATATPTPSAAAPSVPAPAPGEPAVKPSEDIVPVPPEPVVDPNVLSLELVAQRNTAASCWSVVNGTVYDLTAWIAQHPGGSARIIGMCGRDASASFNGKHGDDSEPATFLAEYRLGELGQPVP
jgi:cytochrome b involved in lipid metabolism